MKLVPAIVAPVKFAEASEPLRKLAEFRFAPPKFAPGAMALLRDARVRLAPRNDAPDRLAVRSVAEVRFAPLKVVDASYELRNEAFPNDCEVKSQPERLHTARLIGPRERAW